MDLVELSDREEIRDVKAKYFRYIDTKQWDRVADLFCADAVFKGTSRPYAGLEDFISSLKVWLHPAISVHQGHTCEFSFSGSGKASVIWAMSDFVEFPDRLKDGPFAGTYGFRGSGHYHDDYVRQEDGKWRISKLELVRLRMDPIREPTTPPRS